MGNCSGQRRWRRQRRKRYVSLHTLGMGNTRIGEDWCFNNLLEAGFLLLPLVLLLRRRLACLTRTPCSPAAARAAAAPRPPRPRRPSPRASAASGRRPPGRRPPPRRSPPPPPPPPGACWGPPPALPATRRPAGLFVKTSPWPERAASPAPARPPRRPPSGRIRKKYCVDEKHD